MFRRLVWFALWIILLWSIVGRRFTSNNASKENNHIIFYSLKWNCQRIEIKTAADEGKVIVPSSCVDIEDNLVT